MAKIDEIIHVLDMDSSLAFGGSPWGHEIDHESVDIKQVDWEKLFPSRKPTDRNTEEDWKIYGDEWTIDLDVATEIFDNASEIDTCQPEEWDVCAWYQPIHFHAYNWGIFIKEECLKRLASKIFVETGISAALLNSSEKRMLAKGLLRTAFSILYHHELYHHKTECLGFRLHGIQKRSSYLDYSKNVYAIHHGTDNQIEEALANAFMYRDVDESSWVSKTLANAARAYLLKSFPRNPPGYRLAPNYLKTKDFNNGQYQLFSQVIDGIPNPTHLALYWQLTPRINHSIFNIKSDIWTVVPKGVNTIIPITAAPLKTCTSDEMIKVCGKHGYRVTDGGKGSHIKLKKSGSPTLIIPSKRDNVSPIVTKNILASLGYKIHQLHELL
jgi:hypothetical protein